MLCQGQVLAQQGLCAPALAHSLSRVPRFRKQGSNGFAIKPRAYLTPTLITHLFDQSVQIRRQGKGCLIALLKNNFGFKIPSEQELPICTLPAIMSGLKSRQVIFADPAVEP